MPFNCALFHGSQLLVGNPWLNQSYWHLLWTRIYFDWSAPNIFFATLHMKSTLNPWFRKVQSLNDATPLWRWTKDQCRLTSNLPVQRLLRKAFWQVLKKIIQFIQNKNYFGSSIAGLGGVILGFGVTGKLSCAWVLMYGIMDVWVMAGWRSCWL